MTDIYGYQKQNEVKALINYDKSEMEIEGSVLLKYKGTKDRVVIPPGVTKIEARAFFGNSNLTDVVVPDSVVSIGRSAFSNCNKLSNIVMPGSVISVGYNAFFGTAWYDRQPDGLVYLRRVLYKYKGKIQNKNINIITGTLAIAEYAFCEAKTNDPLQQSLFGFNKYVICNVPASVTCIGVGAFELGLLTSTFIYQGTKDEWRKIEKGEEWSYSSNHYLVSCKDGIINCN
ncbi:MAG: leucine-rich repeat protein [Christensenellales bacterium]